MNMGMYLLEECCLGGYHQEAESDDDGDLHDDGFKGFVDAV